MQEVLGGLADLAEATLLEFVDDAPGAQQQQQQKGAAAAGGTPTAPAGPAGPGSPRPGAGPSPRAGGTPRRRALSRPRTPLSTAEAVEIVLGAAGEEEEARRARAEGRLSRQRSAGETAVTASRTASLDAPLGLALGSARADSTPGSSAKWRALFQSLLPRRRRAGRPLWRGYSLELGPRAASLPEPDAGMTAAGAAAAETGGAGTTPLPSPWDQLPEAPPSVPYIDLGPPAAAFASQSPASPFETAMGNGGAAAGSTPFGLAPPTGGGSGGGSASASASASGQATPQQGRGSLEGSSPALQPRGSLRGSLEGSPPPPLQLPSPQRAQRRAASQVPDLPTVVSQQVLHAEDLPSLPPLHIPLHHQLTIAEDPGTATSAASAQQAQRGDPAGGGGSTGSTPRRTSALLRRPSSSSTAFWLGTPKAPHGRRQRSRWLQERALGRSFMAGAAEGEGAAQQGRLRSWVWAHVLSAARRVPACGQTPAHSLRVYGSQSSAFHSMLICRPVPCTAFQAPPHPPSLSSPWVLLQCASRALSWQPP